MKNKFNSLSSSIHIIKQWIIPLLMLCVSIAFSDTYVPIKSHHANYKVSVRGIDGILATTVSEFDKKYKAINKLETKGIVSIFMRGSVTESSEFFIDNKKLKPLLFTSTDTLSSKDKKIIIDFDWKNNKISTTIGDTNDQRTSKELIYDRISLKYALMTDLKNNQLPNYYKLFEGEEIKHIEISNVGKKNINVPFGEFEVIGVKNQAKGSSKLSILWCAEELDYLPVQIEQYRSNKLWMRANLIEYQPIL